MSCVHPTGTFTRVGGPAKAIARRLRPAMIAGVALGGCVCGHLRSKDQLSLDKVEPSVSIAGICTPLLLRGNGFRPGVITDVEDKDAPSEPLSLPISPMEIAYPILRADGGIEATLPTTPTP